MKLFIILCVIIIISIISIVIFTNKNKNKNKNNLPHSIIPKLRIQNVKDFGAKGDGLTDDTTAIKNAINAISVNDAKIKTLFIPEGTYLTKSILLRNIENITIFGQNRNTTMIKLETISNNSAHVINLMDIKNITIKGLTIDGSKDAIQQQIEDGTRKIITKSDGTTRPMSGGHGIRTGGDFHIGLVLDDIIIQNCHSYAIGFQKGNNSNFYLNNFILRNAGADAMDFKNKFDGNGNITITNGFIKNFGTDHTQIGKAGIDIRGNATISNINIELNNPTNRGIRIRRGGEQHGLGGEGVINNINILGAEDVIDKSYIGIAIEPRTPENYTFNNIYVKNAKLASILGIGGVFNNMVSENAPGEGALDIGWDCSNREPEDCNAGQNIMISNLQIKNPNESAIRMRETAKNVIINGFNISDINNSKKSIKIYDQASNISLSNGFIPTVNSIEGNAIKNNILTSI